MSRNAVATGTHGQSSITDKEIKMILTKDGKKRLLKAEEIECRVGQKTKDKSKYSVLLYKTARTDMDILDEIFGSLNWKSAHYEVKGKDYCMIEVRVERDGFSEWIGKSDCGRDYQRIAEDGGDDKKGLNEYEKSESSDAFKRAGFQFGIGRELYSAPQIWIDSEVSPYSLVVQDIQYDDNDKICTLVLSSKGKIVYEFRNGKGLEKKPAPDHDTLERIRDIVDKLEFEGKKTEDILAFYNVKTIGEIPLEKWEKMLAKVRGEI